MALRILTGVLTPKERSGTATIHFHPHTVTGDADGVEREETGASGTFISRPGKVLSIREFRVEDKDTFWGGSEKDWFRITDHDWTTNHLEVEWSCESGAWIREISYLIVGDAHG
jgi:tRNA U55 pseudouridine synthase TruB